MPHGRINHSTTLFSRSRVIFAHTLLCTPRISKIQQPRSYSNCKDNPKRGLEINNRNKEVEYYLLHHCSTRGRCEYISSDISHTNNKGGAAHCVLLQFFKRRLKDHMSMQSMHTNHTDTSLPRRKSCTLGMGIHYDLNQRCIAFKSRAGRYW